MTKKERAKIKAELRAEQKRRKLQKTDGLGPLEKKKVRNALRLVWQRSHARNLVVERCTDADGFTFCEKCRARTPKLKIDHVERVGEVDSGFVERLFVSSAKLQGLCKKCHDLKTNLERKEKKPSKDHDFGF